MVFRKLNLVLKIALFFLVLQTNAQQFRPDVQFPTGLPANVKTRFTVSPRNSYLLASTENGEYLVWDLRNSKQMLSIRPTLGGMDDAFIYLPYACFSPDERYALLPEFPLGNYILYDLQAQKIAHRFVPFDDENEEHYTHAQFSADGQQILLISQSASNHQNSMLRLFDLKGEFIKLRQLKLPAMIDNNSLAVKILLGKMAKQLKRVAIIQQIAFSPTLELLYLHMANNGVYRVDFNKGTRYTETLVLGASQQLPVFNYTPSIAAMQYRNGRLFVETEKRVRTVSGCNEFYDTIYVVDASGSRKEKTILGRVMGLSVNERSNGFQSDPITADASLSLYFDAVNAKGPDDLVVAKDILTDQPLFSYRRGQPFFYNTQGEYEGGSLNGGYILAVSDDRKTMIENTREVLVHDLESGRLKGVVSATRGLYKMAEPIFLDKERVLFPKLFQDAFLYNLGNAEISRLRSELNCQDTARNGANVYFDWDPTVRIGLRTASLSLDKKRVLLANMVPNDICGKKDDKYIEVWAADSLRMMQRFLFSDPYYTYYLTEAGHPQRFLVNHQLVDFSRSTNAQVTPLWIIQKKDTFFAHNPVYLEKEGKIFSVLATRANPGSPNLIFAFWDMDGKLLKSFVHKRKKSKLDMQAFLFEALLSPNGKHLLYTLYDGEMGIFDIAAGKVSRTFDAGGSTYFKKFGLKHATFWGVQAACFIDDNRVVTAGSFGEILLWNIAEDKPLRQIGPANAVGCYALSPSPDGRYVFAVMADKTVQLIDLEQSDPLLKIAAFDYESIAIVNKEGYYTSNKKANRYLSFGYGGKAYEFSQFDLQLNRPDKVLASTQLGDPTRIAELKSAYERRVRQMGLTLKDAENINGTGPELKVLQMPASLRVKDSTAVTFRIQATDKISAINRIYVSVNGTPLYGMAGRKPEKNGQKEWAGTLKIPLSAGRNEVTMSVMNDAGVESLKENFVVENTGRIRKPDLYILTIGVSKYQQAKFNLTYADKDATDLAALFQTKNTSYGKVNLQTLLNEKATIENIMKLKTWLAKSQVDDHVLIFYAGHGKLDDSLRYYLGTYGMDFSKPAKSGLAFEQLESLLDNIPARNKVMLIDACHSGEVDKEAGWVTQAGEGIKGKVKLRSGDKGFAYGNAAAQRSYLLMKDIFTDLRRSTGATIVSSAGGAEFAWEGPDYQNGVFTYCLLKALKEKAADENKNGSTSVLELQAYLRKEVAELTGGRQQPTIRTENQLVDFTIW